ncbi:hypothetical protein [Marinoscillum sp. MHG1-6]|uniref:hypothetical protein n=1 Tax=Marinoscillum sp. MHG1-6 TaxID=2959627 RepID=UPI0021585031|nr:hypothetical protein [Marinoscillum sp. MHG1-6]
MIKNTNDGGTSEPYLRLDLNYWNSHDLPEFSSGPHNASDLERHLAIMAAGYSGVQDGNPKICEEIGLKLTGQFRMNKVGELDEKVKEWTDGPYDCATIHVGWGMESDLEVDRLIDYVIETSTKSDFPIYVETHRATVTQDMQRTEAMIRRFPNIRFNGDFSHWYTGLEMVNGDIEDKWEFMAPVFERVRFIHGRIGTPGCIQMDIPKGIDQPYVAHFKEMWTRSFIGFLKNAQLGDYICFTPELLPSEYYYAQLMRNEAGEYVEAGDRWSQAIMYCELAKECWAEAQNRLKL